MRGQVYFLPCYASELPFLIWINMSRDHRKFDVKVFIENTQMCIDPAGKNSVSSFVRGNYLHVISSSAAESQLICFTTLDISQVESGKVVEYATHTYSMNDFKNPYTDKKLENDLNIRDIVAYSVYTPYESDNPLRKAYQVIAS